MGKGRSGLGSDRIGSVRFPQSRRIVGDSARSHAGWASARTMIAPTLVVPQQEERPLAAWAGSGPPVPGGRDLQHTLDRPVLAISVRPGPTAFLVFPNLS